MTRYCNLVGCVPVKAMAYEDVEFYHVVIVIIMCHLTMERAPGFTPTCSLDSFPYPSRETNNEAHLLILHHTRTEDNKRWTRQVIANAELMSYLLETRPWSTNAADCRKSAQKICWSCEAEVRELY
jgi:hypothetical protein